MITTERLLKLCDDLGLEPENVALLVLSFKMQAKNMLEYTLQEFITGMNAFGADNVTSLKDNLEKYSASMSNISSSLFSDVYKFAFDYARIPKSQKSLTMEVALPLWEILLKSCNWELLDRWLMFLKNEKSLKRGISKDEWRQFLEFAKTSKVENGVITNLEENSAWPVLLDEFVEYLKRA